MCYAVYLIHFSFIKAYSSHMRKPLYFTEFYLYIIYVGILACSFILASMASVGIEMPFLNLDTLLFPNNAKTTKSKLLLRLEIINKNFNYELIFMTNTMFLFKIKTETKKLTTKSYQWTRHPLRINSKLTSFYRGYYESTKIQNLVGYIQNHKEGVKIL